MQNIANQWLSIGGRDSGGAQGNFGNNGSAHFLNCGDGFTVTCMSNSSNCRRQLYTVYALSIMILLFKKWSKYSN